MDNLTEWQEFSIAVCELDEQQKEKFLNYYAVIVDADPTIGDYKACRVALERMGISK